MASDREDRLPPWLLWSERPLPDTNLLLLPGRHPAMIDSGFVGHADQTAERASAQLGQVELVVNTHWHSDHVGGNARMQSAGAGIAGSLPDSEAVNRRDPGCCVAEYLDPSPPTPSTRPSATTTPCTWATPNGKSSPHPATPGATCACGSPRTGSSPSATRCRTTTSAGSTSRSTDPARQLPHWPRSSG